MEAWNSWLMPYPALLLSQIAILAIPLEICRELWVGAGAVSVSRRQCRTPRKKGAFGTHLLEEDVAISSLIFSPSDILNADAHALSARAGRGLMLRPDLDFSALLSL
jgi:hypothetical protein